MWYVNVFVIFLVLWFFYCIIKTRIDVFYVVNLFLKPVGMENIYYKNYIFFIFVTFSKRNEILR